MGFDGDEQVAENVGRGSFKAEGQPADCGRPRRMGWGEIEKSISKSTLRRHARTCRGHPRLACYFAGSKEDVDGRDETGHDLKMPRSKIEKAQDQRERRAGATPPAS